MEERIDEIGFGNLKLIQKPEDFCYGVDAVLLADFALKTAKKGESTTSIMDLGTGTGIVPLILWSKTKAPRIEGIEVQKGSYDRAIRSAKINGIQDYLSFINMDVKDVPNLGKEHIGAFELVTTNPPYTEGEGGIKSDNTAKMIARHETTANLDDFVRAAAMLLRDRGDFAMVHRPSRMVDICCICRKYHLEPKEIQLVSPREGEEANIMLIHCVKNGGRQLKLLKELHVYEANNYSKEIKNMYR